MNAITAHAVTASLEARISVLWQRRAVDRRVYGAAWPQGRHDRQVALRELVAVARAGRRLARQTMEQGQQPSGVSLHDWQAA